jgi:hypothetical protein
MAGTIVVDRIESDGSYASTINVASKVNFAGGMQVGGQDTAFSGMRNHIINGAFNVWQRGTSFSYTILSAGTFNADRFWAYSAVASSGTYGRSTDVPTGQPFLYSFANDTNVPFQYGTNVELTAAGNAKPFIVGQTYTLSFWVKGSSNASDIVLYVNWRNSHANGTNNTQAVVDYPTYNITTSWQKIAITFTLSANPVSQNLVLDFENTLPAGAKTTGWQLEAGSVATSFEQRPLGLELDLCKRYYQEQGTVLAKFQSPSVNTSRTIDYILSPEMRTTPTVTVIDAGEFTNVATTNRLGNSSKLVCIEGTVGNSGNYGFVSRISFSSEL